MLSLIKYAYLEAPKQFHPVFESGLYPLRQLTFLLYPLRRLTFLLKVKLIYLMLQCVLKTFYYLKMFLNDNKLFYLK